jgi:predicted RNase H-like HicB family nuclease
MLSQYIQAAMRQAKYDILNDDDKSYYGEIPGFQGVYANAELLGDCRDELLEVLEQWIVYRLSKNLPLPTVDGLKLSVERVPEEIL